MATIVTRSGKGSPLTNNEVDANFTNLNTELGTKADASSLSSYQPLDGDLTSIAGLVGTTGLLRKTAANSFSLDTSAYLTTESDPTVPSHVKEITTTKISNWDAAFGWGNHASVGYLTGITSGNVTTALGYTPANRAGDTFTGDISVPITKSFNCYTVNYGMGTPDSSGLQIYAAAGDTMRFGHRTGGVFTERFIMGTGGNVTANVDFRAPIFYDSNDTGRYLDPSSTSVLTTVEAYNGSGFRSYSTPSSGINSQIYFANAANTRAWNWQLDENDAAALWSYGGSSWGKRLGLTHNSELFLRNSSGSDVSLAYPSTFGYSSSYKTMVLGNQSLTTVCIGVSPASNPSGSFNGGGLGLEVMFRNGVNFITPNSANNGYHFPLSLADGYAASSGSFRAPIFYDTDNTGYYVDAAGTSVLGGIVLNGTLDVRDSYAQFWRSTNGAYQRVDTRTEATSLSRAHWYGVSSSGGTSNFRHAWYDNAAYFNVTAQDGEIIFERTAGDTIVRSTGSFRAPAFYDSNDTAFFLDPNSTSVLSTVRANAIQHVNGNNVIALTDASYLYFRSPDNGIRLYLGGADPANYYDNDAHNFRNRSGGQYATIAASGMFAPAFYDYANTAYYVDPNSTSNLYRTNGDGFAATQFLCGTTNYGDVTAGSTWYGIGRSTTTGWTAGGMVQAAGYTGLRLIGGGAVLDISGPNYGNGWIYSGNAMALDNQLRAQIYYDVSNTGYYVDPNSTSVLLNLNLYGGLTANGSITVGNGATSSDIYMADSDEGTRRIHCNSNRIGFLTQAEGWGAYCSDNGDWTTEATGYASSSFRAPVFYDNDNTAYYINAAASSNLSRLTLADRSMASSAFLSMSGLDQNTWYPVTIPINAARQTRLRIENALNSNVPSWSTHPAGFSCYVEWTSNGAGWGTIGLNRRVVDWRESFTSVQIVGGIDQLTQSSTEVIWLRGGGNYFFSADNDVNPTIHTSTYTINGQSVSPRSTTYNTPWTASTGQTGAAILYATSTITSATDVRAPIFYDSNDTSYYVDANSTSVLNGINVWGEIGSRRNDVQSLLRSYNLSAGGPLQFYLDHNYGNVNIGNSRGVVFAGGSYWEIANSVRAPVFYDSNDTARYFDGNGGINFLTGASNRVTIYSDDSGLHAANAEGIGGDVRLGAAWNRAGSYSNGGYTLGSEAWIAFWISGLEKGYIDSSSNLFMNGSVRAPVFYDSNDTGYYVDPNTTATSFRGRGEIFLGPNTSGEYTRLGGNGGGTDHATVSASNGNLHIDAKSGFNIYLAWYNTSTVNLGGSLYANGNITAYSDIRVKANVETIPSALDKLDHIRGVTYTRTDLEDKERRYGGVIAQEIEAVLPEAVFETHDHKSVDYNATIALLIQAVKELRDEVEMLRK